MGLFQVHRVLPSEWGHQNVMVPISWCRGAPGPDSVIRGEWVRNDGDGEITAAPHQVNLNCCEKSHGSRCASRAPQGEGLGGFGFWSLFQDTDPLRLRGLLGRSLCICLRDPCTPPHLLCGVYYQLSAGFHS